MTVRDLTILGCASQQPTRRRNHGAYIVRWNNEGFLFDPGEGTQRQFIFANLAPTCVTRIFISHFHGDHCLGVGSMLMRLNLDKVKHPIHCYYPASGEVYFKRLRYGTIYHENIQVIEHPISRHGLIEETDDFLFYAYPLDHGIENLGWRIEEKPMRKFDVQKLQEKGVKGPKVRLLEEQKELTIEGKKVRIEEVSFLKKGAVFSVVIDTLPCEGALLAAKESTLFLCESTFLEEHAHLAKDYHHMTAQQAATLAQKAGVKKLVLTHFSARYQELDCFEKEARALFIPTEAADDLKVFSF